MIIPGISQTLQKVMSGVISQRGAPTPPAADTQITQRPNDPFNKKDGIEPSPVKAVKEPETDGLPEDSSVYRLPQPDFKITRVVWVENASVDANGNFVPGLVVIPEITERPGDWGEPIT